MKLPLQYYDSPWLRKRVKEIETITDEVRQMAADMIETMNAHNGIGIAAPQVGLDARIFITKCPKELSGNRWEDGIEKVYINPKILNRSDDFVQYDDGCLSIPGLYLPNLRPQKIVVEALDLEGKTFTETLEYFYAFNFCHELDHLNGVLFIDRLDRRTRNQIKPLLQKIKDKYRTLNDKTA